MAVRRTRSTSGGGRRGGPAAALALARRGGPAAVLALVLAAAGPAPAAGQAPRPLLPVDLAWRTALAAAPRHAPAYDDARVYVALRDGALTALDLRTGQPVWTVAQGVDQPPVAGGGLVVVASGAQLVGLRAADGRPRWVWGLGSPVAAPLLWNAGWLVAAAASGEVVVLRAADGLELWRRALGGLAAGAPAIGGGRLFVPLVDGRIAALALDTGAVLWEQTIPGRPQGLLPVDALFVGSTDNLLYRLALEDGRLDWYWRAGSDVVGAPVVDADRVYFTARDNLLRALDRGHGARRWRRVLAGRPGGGPIRAGSVIVVAGVSAVIELFDAATGEPRGRYVAPDELAAPPRLVPAADPADPADPTLVLVTGGGAVIALAPGAGPPRLSPARPPQPLLPRPVRRPLARLVDWLPLRTPGAAP